jgi:PPOX class probable F420-dependent enzyme
MSALERLGREKAVLLQTRKRDGSWVSTPVSIVVDGGRAFFKSYDASGKAKRLRNFPEVKVAPSTMRGKPTGPAIGARATLLGDSESERIGQLLARKHPLLHGRLVPAWHRRKGWTTLYYELTLEQS